MLMSKKNLAQIKAQIRQCKQRPKLESQINCLQDLFFKTNNYLVALEIGHLLRQFHPNEAKVYYGQAVEIASDEETKENIKKKIQEISERKGQIPVRLNFRDLPLPSLTVSIPTEYDFRRVLREAFQVAENAGADYLIVKAGDLHRHVGGYLGHNHRMPVCCQVMRNFMRYYRGIILYAPPRGNGATLEIEYDLRAERNHSQKPEAKSDPEDKYMYFVDELKVYSFLKLAIRFYCPEMKVKRVLVFELNPLTKEEEITLGHLTYHAGRLWNQANYLIKNKLARPNCQELYNRLKDTSIHLRSLQTYSAQIVLDELSRRWINFFKFLENPEKFKKKEISVVKPPKYVSPEIPHRVVTWDKTGFRIKGSKIRLSISKSLKDHLLKKFGFLPEYLWIDTGDTALEALDVLNVKIVPYKSCGHISYKLIVVYEEVSKEDGQMKSGKLEEPERTSEYDVVIGKKGLPYSGDEIWVYINYPNKRIVVHQSGCQVVDRARKRAEGVKMRVEVAKDEKDAQTILKRTQFQASADYNDLWLALDFGNEERQIAFAKRIPSILAQRYSPFRNVETEFCGVCFRR